MHTRSAVCRCLLLICSPFIAMGAKADNPDLDTAHAVNSLGLDLYREQIKTANGTGVLLSPYSIAVTLAMTYLGADGATKVEMQKVLNLPDDPAACGAAFQSLANQLAEVVTLSKKQVARLREDGGSATPIRSNIVNRLFVQHGFSLRPSFVERLHRYFDSDATELDFQRDPKQGRQVINEWVERQTHERIRGLLPPGQPEASTRLALVNAFYLRAAWAEEFPVSTTKPEEFHLTRAEGAPVTTMGIMEHLGYAKFEDYTVVTLPFLGNGLQFVLLIPDAIDGLANLERTLTPEALGNCTRLPRREVILHLPKFKLAPATLQLVRALESLGLRTAFDQPPGSANFEMMAPRRPDSYLYVGAIYHKAWLVLDEHGTEAAAATEATLATFGVEARSAQTPMEVRADRPFLFAIQHVQSGACLFLGRVTDPR